MTSIKHLTALTLAAAAFVPAAAQALPKAPPIKGGVHCTQHVKKSYRLSQVLRHGLDVKVTCDGPAHFLVSLDFPAMTRQSRDITHIMGHTSLPAIAYAHEITLTHAGTAKAHQKLVPVAARVAKRYRRSKVLVLFAVEREDGYMWSEGKLNKRTVLVR